MASRFVLWTLCAAATLVDWKPAHALPSFGTKLPNGDKVPCPPSEKDDGCSTSGYCMGLGHPHCGGFRPEDNVEGITSLSPFGEDFRANGFAWTTELCQMDSDGDGYTNGEELGDPCCVWKVGTPSAPLDAMEGFLPSHPGMPDHTPPEGFTFDKEALCGSIIEDPKSNSTNTTKPQVEDDIELEDPYDVFYNPEETRGSFDLRIEPYPIPIETTTYVNFYFNLPESLPDLVHVVWGEAINSQPDHLHHFILFGCTDPVDESLEGRPLEKEQEACPLQLGGWAPGADLFGNDSLETGVAFGRTMGYESLRLQIHYTDGVYENIETKTHRMATDGIRVHYTTDFRPYTLAKSRLLWVSYGPEEMNVPANTSRYFVSRTCKVDTYCKDTNDDTLKEIVDFLGIGATAGNLMGGSSMTCSGIQGFCFLPGRIGRTIQQLCPQTCGLCESSEAGENPRNPSSYRVTSVSYHAHLLGTEMYTTLLRQVEEDETLSLPVTEGAVDLMEPDTSEGVGRRATTILDQNQTAAPSNSTRTAPKLTRTVTKDLKSREVWYYDDQATIPMDYEIAENSNETLTPTLRGVEVRPGDSIQATCVYDSTQRSQNTRFGLSTYDEMCIVSLRVTFPTPESLLRNESSVDNALDIDVFTDIKLRAFSCEIDREGHTTDIYQGILNDTEDGRNIWRDHPIEDSDQCTFPVENYVIVDSFMTQGVRNCPENQASEPIDVVTDGQKHSGDKLCHGLSNVTEFLSDAIAGYTCEGGAYDQRDGSEITERECIFKGGGIEYTPYTCAEIERWMMDTEAVPGGTNEDLEFLRQRWQPVCCLYQEDDGERDNISDEESNDDSTIPSKASSGLSTLELVKLLACLGTVLTIM